MFAKVPLVGTTAGGIPDLVTHEKEGLLVPAGDSDALASAILRMHTEKDLKSRLVEAAYQRVTTEFTRERELTKWISVYRNAGLCS